MIARCAREFLPPRNGTSTSSVERLQDIELPGGVRPTVSAALPWSDYADLVSKMDLGLCLMDTSHPSYPPLDLAAAGAVVVTNTHGSKQSLQNWSNNIIAAPPTILALVDALRHGVMLSRDTLDDFEPEPRRSSDGVFDLMGVVARVGQYEFEPGNRAVAILYAGGVDDHAQGQAFDVDKACSLRPFTFLPAW